tara:strand:- start:372 stop:581 length:210 start_codon:yes stop_codon:yes gene_type:complete
MKSLFIILKNVRNLLPYLFIISIYFLFINFEAKKEKINNRDTEYKNIISNDKSNSVGGKIKIPVIPYEQ